MTSARLDIDVDGRRVAVHELSRGERTVVFCHPAPGAGCFDPDPQQTAARDLRLLGVDRPGYGDSDPMPAGQWATVAAAADDVAAVLDALEADAVGVAGWSAGGRVALALAARRPDLVDRVVVLATPAPHEDVSWIPPEHAAGLDALRGLGADEANAALTAQLAPIAGASGDGALDALGRSSADGAALQWPGARAGLERMVTAAFAQGAIGLASDMAGYCLQPWGFEPAEVAAKTLLLYGSRDPLLTAAHPKWWKGRLPSSRIEMVPNAGHLLISPMWKRTLSHLAPGATR